ncbi:MAG: hypothetical protein JWO50_232, partial [Candidatus Kaiserbacteria bacterium]|nr:hypothetical protein [Candidatus Kaiserbacteria bacterium]
MLQLLQTMKSLHIFRRANFIGVISVLILLAPTLTFAISYTPGQTLDPSCSPSDPTCLVVNTTITAANINATSTTATSTFAGGFNVANGGLLYDRSTGFVGIGTTTPSATLAVNSVGVGGTAFSIWGTPNVSGVTLGVAGPAFTVTNAGNVGIGISNPSDQLHINVQNPPVVADATFYKSYVSTAANQGLVMSSYVRNTGPFQRVSDIVALGVPAGGLSGGELRFLTNSGTNATATPRLVITNTGNVGIGINAPTTPLHVKGLAGKITGTVTTSGTAVTGVSTLFTTEVAVGDTLQVGSLTGVV